MLPYKERLLDERPKSVSELFEVHFGKKIYCWFIELRGT